MGGAGNVKESWWVNPVDMLGRMVLISDATVVNVGMVSRSTIPEDKD